MASKFARVAPLRVCLLSAGLSLAALAFAADEPAAPASGGKMQFAEGTATASDVCGACHQAIYQEFSGGRGADLHWRGMHLAPKDKTVLNLPNGASRSAAAHFLAGTDPFPVAAAKAEEEGKPCNVCHYPQPLQYPDANASKIDKPAPRAEHRERGVTCASCHLTPEGKIRGPYEVDAPHETVADARMQTSVACAYCHSVGERVVAKQTQTYLEWRDDFYKPGLGRQQCQDCHMPRTVRKLAEDFAGPERAVGRHLFTGGHSFQRVSSALDLAIAQPESGSPRFVIRLTNVGAGHSVPTGSNRRGIYLTAEVLNAKGKVVAAREWLFAPWFGNRPDDKAFVAEDLKGPDPIATSQADAQGPHETIIRAGEERLLQWNPQLADGRYTVRAKLIYDLNRYNDRAFKDDQREIGNATLPVKVLSPAKAVRSNGDPKTKRVEANAK